MAQLTRKVCGPDFKAKFDGSCKRCDGEIRRGYHFITKVEGVDGVFHSDCGRAYCRTLDEHLPEEADESPEAA